MKHLFERYKLFVVSIIVIVITITVFFGIKIYKNLESEKLIIASINEKHSIEGLSSEELYESLLLLKNDYSQLEENISKNIFEAYELIIEDITAKLSSEYLVRINALKKNDDLVKLIEEYNDESFEEFEDLISSLKIFNQSVEILDVETKDKAVNYLSKEDYIMVEEKLSTLLKENGELLSKVEADKLKLEVKIAEEKAEAERKKSESSKAQMPANKGETGSSGEEVIKPPVSSAGCGANEPWGPYSNVEKWEFEDYVGGKVIAYTDRCGSYYDISGNLITNIIAEWNHGWSLEKIFATFPNYKKVPPFPG